MHSTYLCMKKEQKKSLDLKIIVVKEITNQELFLIFDSFQHRTL